jgi:hypothetical protein
MSETFRDLGRVKLVQIQPNGLIIETPSGYIYDASRLVKVDRLHITSLGIEADIPDGERVLDIHHINHPKKAYDRYDLISIGFTSHYQAMRTRFGDHMVDGIAGENIIIDFEEEVWPQDLGRQIGIENTDTRQLALMDMVSFASPCQEFSHFAAQNQDTKLPPDKLKSILDFLGNGRRGYLFVLSENQDEVTVMPGDKVFVVSTG